MIVHIRDLIKTDILAGAINGKTVFATCVSLTADDPVEPTALFLDFTDIEVATASALRESVIALKAYKRSIASNLYPVLANVNDSIQDEIHVLMDARNDAIIACNRADDGRVSQVRLIGDLDPKQAMTFELVSRLNGADAGGLMKQFGKKEKTTSTTAWNNRLSSLVQRGLLREFTNGRSKFYRPLLEEAS
jgi:hypothetical protein